MDPSCIRISGPLAPYLEGLWSDLESAGYAPLSAANVARLMAHVSRWLADKRLPVEALDSGQIEVFVRHRRSVGYTHHVSERGLAPILHHLRKVGVVSEEEGRDALDPRLHSYRSYLQNERALVPSTVRLYLMVAGGFLDRYVGGSVSELTVADVCDFVVRESRQGSVGYTKLKVTALRSFLRYLYVGGELTVDLAASVPAAAGWRLASLPKALSAEEVRRLLRSCDRRTHVGRRDYAALLLMVRLGLRAGEVAALELDDVHWTRGELVIHGKGGQSDRLPLVDDVGAALASYVRRSRPHVSSRKVFLGVRAPHGALSPQGVTAIVYGASRRAALAPLGAHRLRHTAATAMLRGGASLSDIAQVLRHRHLDTTAIYAKVDRASLRALAQPWPEVPHE